MPAANAWFSRDRCCAVYVSEGGVIARKRAALRIVRTITDALSPLRDDRRLSRCDGVRHPSLPRPTHSAYMPAGQLKTRFKKLLHRLYISSFHGRLLRQVGRRGCTSLPCQSVPFACISAGSLLREDSMRIGLFAAGYTWEALLNNPSE